MSEADEPEDVAAPPRLEPVALPPVPEVGEAAPRREAGISRLPVAEQSLAYYRVETVRAEEEVAPLLASAREERRDARAVLPKTHAFGVEPYRVVRESGEECFLQLRARENHVQAEPFLQNFGRDLRDPLPVPGADGTPDLLPPDRPDRVRYTYLLQRLHRVRPHRDAGPDLAQLRGLLEDDRLNPYSAQRDSGG